MDAGQDAHFVDSILLVFVRLCTNLNLLEGVDLTVLYALNFIYARIRTITELHQYQKVF